MPSKTLICQNNFKLRFKLRLGLRFKLREILSCVSSCVSSCDSRCDSSCDLNLQKHTKKHSCVSSGSSTWGCLNINCVASPGMYLFEILGVVVKCFAICDASRKLCFVQFAKHCCKHSCFNNVVSQGRPEA